VQLINKVSQNLHSELMIRRLAFKDRAIFEAGSPESPNTLERGLANARQVFVKAGIPRAGYDFSDGSGMSTYNRVSPRAAVALLRWGKTQPWGQQWRESFPIGGLDGTLRRRFAGTPLQGRIFAKTGTLNATNALSGYLIAASGQELTISIFANDVPDGGNAVPVMDEAVQTIAAVN
jgi:D-alanyl-D-alanine carboxypeptidase/D-alanyl-D-alanine-endopeptidase (penicillin-binding protein 4)